MTYFINEREITVVWIMKTLSHFNLKTKKTKKTKTKTKNKNNKKKNQPRKKHKKD